MDSPLSNWMLQDGGESALPSLNLDRARVRPNDKLNWRRTFLGVLSPSAANDLLPRRLQRRSAR